MANCCNWRRRQLHGRSLPASRISQRKRQYDDATSMTAVTLDLQYQWRCAQCAGGNERGAQLPQLAQSAASPASYTARFTGAACVPPTDDDVNRIVVDLVAAAPGGDCVVVLRSVDGLTSAFCLRPPSLSHALARTFNASACKLELFFAPHPKEFIASYATLPLMRFKPRYSAVHNNRRKPQETANIPRRPWRSRIDLNQNLNLPRPSSKRQQPSADKNIRKTA